MKRYLIENAKCGITDGGIACGPVSGSVIATVKFKEGEKSQYFSLAEVSGFPNFFLTDKDVFDDLTRQCPCFATSLRWSDARWRTLTD